MRELLRLKEPPKGTQGDLFEPFGASPRAIAMEITWKDDDLSSRGHGIEISCDHVVVAFIEGYRWCGGRHAEVRLLAEDASEWSEVAGEVATIREGARAIVLEVLRDKRMQFTRGRFDVCANA